MRRALRAAGLAGAILSLAAGVSLAATTAGPGTIVTVAGTGVVGGDGDGGAATAAAINHPRGLTLAPGGGFVFADAFGQTVRRVWPDGHITTVAGTGEDGYSGDGGPATAAALDQPHGVAFTPDGRLLVADALNNRIRAVGPDGTITTVAGTGAHGFSGDGGPARDAAIAGPRGIAALPGGGFLIPDSDNQRIRRVAPDGTITTVAGAGVRGFGGDGGPALAAELNEPFGVVPTADGGLLIADTGNNRVRSVSPEGTISTVAGTGVAGFSGDGGPATAAALSHPHNVAVLPDGGFLIADTGNNRVRRVWPDGTITTIAGTGAAGFSGDAGPPADAELDQPKALLVLPDYQAFLVADAGNSRIREIVQDLRRPLALTLASDRLRVRRGRDAALAIEVDDDVAVDLQGWRLGKTALTLSRQVAKGRSVLRFGRQLAPGRYRLLLAASSPTDRPVLRSLTLTVAR